MRQRYQITIAAIEETYKKFFPGNSFEYSLLEDNWISVNNVSNSIGLLLNWIHGYKNLSLFAVCLIQAKSTRAVHFKRYFIRAIKKHFPSDASSLVRELDDRFQVLSVDTKFASHSSNPIDRRLDFAAYFLGLIQTLEGKNQSYEQIKNICLEITYDYVTPKNAFQKWIKKLPAKLVGHIVATPLIRAFHTKISKLGHPDGFRAVIVTDKKLTYGLGYGFDILECGICKLFEKHGAHKYASILCEVDKVTSNLAGLELIRNSTIACGAEKCDFRFKRLRR